MSEEKLRALSAEEISALQAQGCQAEDWSRIQVGDGFAAASCHNVRFFGDNVLGAFDGTVSLPGGIRMPAGIDNATLVGCRVGGGAYISNIGTQLVNLDVQPGAVIENSDRVAASGESSFGNGVTIEVLNEGGGRDLPLFDELSAPLAYMTVLYRDRAAFIAKVEELIVSYATDKKSARARIGRGARISNCGTILDVCVGDHAVVDGAERLENGTIVSSEENPSRVGSGVIARDFIFLAGSAITDGVIVTDSFVGEGARLGRQFSAENCAFFANAEGYHGEAVATFAGPYAVTHHKSTLLIAGLFSFYNAGSGTNQSNHLYKLGPVHQGLLERGAKTGSSSYLLWPSRVGAFTAVIGKHYANFDAHEFPFSYIDDAGGKSNLVPAMNFFTVGTVRDGAKWPTRDRRKGDDKRDPITFAVLNPYTVNAIYQGIDALNRLAAETDRSVEAITYKGLTIRRLLLKTCRRYYELALARYFGQQFAARIESAGTADLAAALECGCGIGAGPWVDLAGMLAPKERVDQLLADVEAGTLASLDDIDARLREIHSRYAEDEWSWVCHTYEVRHGKAPCQLTAAEIAGVLEEWKSAEDKLTNMVLADAAKEFSETVRTGFGIDGDKAVRDADFAAVRGTESDNSFINGIKSDLEQLNARVDALIAQLQNGRD